MRRECGEVVLHAWKAPCVGRVGLGINNPNSRSSSHAGPTRPRTAGRVPSRVVVDHGRWLLALTSADEPGDLRAELVYGRLRRDTPRRIQSSAQ